MHLIGQNYSHDLEEGLGNFGWAYCHLEPNWRYKRRRGMEVE
jgi:hypothetical protein